MMPLFAKLITLQSCFLSTGIEGTFISLSRVLLRPHRLEFDVKLVGDVVDNLVYPPVPVGYASRSRESSWIAICFATRLLCLFLPPPGWVESMIPPVPRRTCNRRDVGQFRNPEWLWRRVPGRPQQQIFEITSDGDQDDVERLEGIPHIAATDAVHVHECVDLAVHEEVI